MSIDQKKEVDYQGTSQLISHYMLKQLRANKKIARVHSVFNTSFNLIFNGYLLNFSVNKHSLSAFGCTVDQHIMKDLLARMKVGDIVRINEMQLTFYTKQDIYELDLSHLKEVDLSIPNIQMSSKKIEQTNLYMALSHLNFEREIGLEINETMRYAFSVLRNTTYYSTSDMEQIVNQLIGRGKGLTPSGDDLLMGYIMVRKAVMANKEDLDVYLKQQLTTNQSTPISMAYYQALFDGVISHLFKDLILSLESDIESDILHRIDLIKSYGHTSGYDTLFGIYLGLQSLVNGL